MTTTTAQPTDAPLRRHHAIVEGELVLPGGRPSVHGKVTRKPRKRKKENAKKRRGKKQSPFTAETADKYELYQYSVQSPDEDVEFLMRVYEEIRGREPRHMREDFCGTALLCSTWIQQGPEFTAEGFDIDPEPIVWGLERNFAPIGEAGSRCRLHVKDVREPSRRGPDVRCGHNFSYCCFKQRSELLAYFRAAYQDLAPGGLFSIDIHGGPESMHEMEEVREIEEGFDYVWDQDKYWPATGEYECHIGFRFEDGSEMRAFSYKWRLWTLPELKDLLLEAGFAQVDSYWEGTDPEDEEAGDGDFQKDDKGENCLSWIAYLIAQK